jgi:hypothetical protein
VIDLRHALDALQTIDPGCTRAEWHEIGRAAIAAGLTVEDIDRWSSTADNYGGTKDVYAAFRGIKPNGKTGPGTLFRAALRAGWKPPRDDEEEKARHEATAARRAAPMPTPKSRQQHERLSPFGHSLLRRCRRPLEGEPRAYLLARECALPPADGDLYCHGAWLHPPSRTTAPALVALVTDAMTGEALTLHSTWTRADGTKAHPRRLLGDHRKVGGVIRLWPDEAVTTGLAIAEGLETALSLAHAFTPVWACIDASNLRAFPVLPGIEALTIGADNDPAGREAAEACALRWHDAGREVRIVMAPDVGADLNDVARAA